jgi:hypothetical protein
MESCANERRWAFLVDCAIMASGLLAVFGLSGRSST